MYAWEIPFQKVVGEKRADELKEVRKATIIRTAFIGFMIFTERTALFITILTFILFGNSMSATVVSINLMFFCHKCSLQFNKCIIHNFQRSRLCSLNRITYLKKC